jgi:hypothetical protein
VADKRGQGVSGSGRADRPGPEAEAWVTGEERERSDPDRRAGTKSTRVGVRGGSEGGPKGVQRGPNCSIKIRRGKSDREGRAAAGGTAPLRSGEVARVGAGAS